MHFKTAGLVAAILLGGCAQPKKLPAEVVAQANTMLMCETTEQCAQFWKRAQVWVQKNAGYKLQVVTDVVIETYNATSYSTGWAFSVTRTPLAGPKEIIEIKPSCGPAPLCARHGLEMEAAFKRYVASGG